jgi:hypothetical protein
MPERLIEQMTPWSANILELLAGVLAAAIGMMRQCIGLAPSPDRHHQCATIVGAFRQRSKSPDQLYYHGHCLGGAGSMELVATILAIGMGIVPPTLSSSEPDPDLCDIYLPVRPVRHPIRPALSNSFAFGGNVASIRALKPLSCWRPSACDSCHTRVLLLL